MRKSFESGLRTVGKYGICFNGRYFNADELAVFKGKELEVGYNDGNLDELRIQLPNGKLIIANEVMPAVFGSIFGPRSVL